MRIVRSRIVSLIMPRSWLSEVSESEAIGPVAKIYSDIRQTTGLPMVNLVYRYLATDPPTLAAAWEQLRPNLQDATVEVSARALPRPMSDCTKFLSTPQGAKIEGSDLSAAIRTVETYGHANRLNLLAVHALLLGCPGTGRGGLMPLRRSSLSTDSLLPMALLQSLSLPVLELLKRISIALTPPGDTLLVPSLFRHFATRPPLLQFLWAAILPCVEGGFPGTTELVAAAAECVSRFPHPVNPLRQPDRRAVLMRFEGAIATMILVGAAIEAVLAEQEVF